MSAEVKTPLRRPAYAKQLKTAAGMPAAQVMVEAHIGKGAWDRAKKRPWWGGNGHAIVIDLDEKTTVTDYDFTCLHGLCVILDAQDCGFDVAHQCAMRMCEHGTRRVMLVHPWARSSSGFVGWKIYRCSLWQ